MNDQLDRQTTCSICHKKFDADKPVAVNLGKTGKASHWKCLFDLLEPTRAKVQQQKKT